MENHHTIFNGKINYFDWAMASSSQTVKSPGRVSLWTLFWRLGGPFGTAIFATGAVQCTLVDH
jgi:hypothetical protein